MIYLKQTIDKVKERFLSQKFINEIQNSFVFQLVVLSQIKSYLYKSVSQQPLFVVPQNIRKNAIKQKKVLVLDMDQTLVYTRRQTKPTHSNFKVIDENDTKMYIEQRPFLRQFLQSVSTIFEVYIYTAGQRQYADKVLNKIDEKSHIKRRFYRQTCKKQNGNFYKDLKHLKKVSKNKCQMILVDDNMVSIGHNCPFSVRIKEFVGDQRDKELIRVFESLLKFYA